MFGQKASFKPTENLEIGFTRNDVFGGQGHVPITFGSFWTSFTSLNDVPPPRSSSRARTRARAMPASISRTGCPSCAAG